MVSRKSPKSYTSRSNCNSASTSNHPPLVHDTTPITQPPETMNNSPPNGQDNTSLASHPPEIVNSGKGKEICLYVDLSLPCIPGRTKSPEPLATANSFDVLSFENLEENGEDVGDEIEQSSACESDNYDPAYSPVEGRMIQQRKPKFSKNKKKHANTALERKGLWRCLNLHGQANVPWVLLGDFNVLLHVNDSFGGALSWTPGMEDFKTCLNKNELEDLRYHGIFHSWTNKSFGCANISRKLDRVLANQAWMAKFPQFECCFKPWGVSDHAPMIMSIGEVSVKRNLPFRFFNFWTQHRDFLSIVSQGWQLEVHGSKMFRVVQKLRALKGPLKQLNKKEFSDISARVQACREDLYSCQSNLDLNPMDDQLRSKEKELVGKFSEWCLAEELFYKQKAQIHWLKEGDQNTFFFMKNFSTKCNRRKVETLTSTDGVQLHDDVLLFSHGSLSSVQIVFQALKQFLEFSGLSINLLKSFAFFSGVDGQTKADILALLQFGTGSLPVSYLGLPLTSKTLSSTDCTSLIEKITARVKRWTLRFFSFAGRTVLVKSILCSMQSYWAQAFVLPKKVIEDVNRVLKRFLWSGPELKASCAKVAWDMVCRLI
ncbi:uncharacterized protein LOC132301347 [Cornus florida]|uniref:uncharacterized protein LOC132301347 n=1 Tax=Cornus florida TaxID=4283 RepID=UPI00289819B3|nr:uncharacterized protein LOC132301347 [Cornus florida]